MMIHHDEDDGMMMHHDDVATLSSAVHSHLAVIFMQYRHLPQHCNDHTSYAS